jgi:thiol-disulfide isomerase/thioredoxin
MKIPSGAFAILVAIAVRVAADEQSAPLPAERTLVVELLDGDGQPVEGADVGICATISGRSPEFASEDGTQWRYWRHARSDAAGRAKLDDPRGLLRGQGVFARHEARHISAVASVDPGKLAEPLKLTLVPETTIKCQVRCEALEKRGRSILPASAGVEFENKRVLIVSDEAGQFRIQLPPGTYELAFDTRGHQTENVTRPIVVSRQGEAIDLGPIDLPATKIELMVGKVAPMIPDVVAWKNGPPVTLTALRGQVILLDFWGHWCGSCVADMPKMFELHGRYRGQGLAIVGIHDDRSDDEAGRIDTCAKLDEELAEVRRGIWGGRDIPFPVALVVGDGAKNGHGASERPRSSAAASYGIVGFPTQVLIDRRGRVVRSFVGGIMNYDDGIELLEKTLREK